MEIDIIEYAVTLVLFIALLRHILTFDIAKDINCFCDLLILKSEYLGQIL